MKQTNTTTRRVGLMAAMLAAAGGRISSAFGALGKKVADHAELHNPVRAFNPYGTKRNKGSVAADKRRARKARNVKMNRRAHRG